MGCTKATRLCFPTCRAGTTQTAFGFKTEENLYESRQKFHVRRWPTAYSNFRNDQSLLHGRDRNACAIRRAPFGRKRRIRRHVGAVRLRKINPAVDYRVARYSHRWPLLSE